MRSNRSEETKLSGAEMPEQRRAGQPHLTATLLRTSKAAFTRIQISGYLDIQMSEIRISSGRLHVSDRNVFGVYTCPDIRMYYTRHTRYVYEKYAKAFFWSSCTCCMPSKSLPFFPFFLLTRFVGWTTRSKFCLVSSVIDYKTQR